VLLFWPSKSYFSGLLTERTDEIKTTNRVKGNCDELKEKREQRHQSGQMANSDKKLATAS
jgi:hypothetical protein